MTNLNAPPTESKLLGTIGTAAASPPAQPVNVPLNIVSATVTSSSDNSLHYFSWNIQGFNPQIHTGWVDMKVSPYIPGPSMRVTVDSNGNGTNETNNFLLTSNGTYIVSLNIYSNSQLHDLVNNPSNPLYDNPNGGAGYPNPAPIASKIMGTIGVKCSYSDRSNMNDTYAESCNSINIANGVISAVCRDYSRKGQSTSLKYCECNQTISNCGGTLVCGECPTINSD
jgi:hypothetical protein